MSAAAPLLLAALLPAATENPPLPRPDLPDQTVIPVSERVVCRDPRLMGEAKPDIVEAETLACGILDPVQVTSVAGIRITPPAVLGCPTARRLADWIDGPVRSEALARLHSRIAEVRTLGSYACRTQNNAAGGRRSEHARGRAVDISSFALTDGRTVSVERHWGPGPQGDFLLAIWNRACGLFTTVLGPRADRHHRDHLHLDTSPRGGIPHCR